MGVQKSDLDFDKIAIILKKEYNIISTEISNIEKGTANIFKINSKEGSYILKEFTTKRNEDTVVKEISITNFLREKGIKVPKYIKTLDGKYYTKNGERIIIVQEFINGRVIENNQGDYSKTIECAEILGKLVKALMDYPKLSDEGIIEKNFSKERLHSGIEKMQKVLDNTCESKYSTKIKEDLKFKIKVSKEIEENFDFDIINKLTIQNSHGDFSIQQLIYDEETNPTVIDFEATKSLPIIWEVMRSYSYIDKEAKDGVLNIDTLIEYVKTFSKYVKLNKYDLKYASYVYLLQLISSAYGYKEYNNDNTQINLLNFAFFRTKLCRYLYENAEEISARMAND